MACPVVETYHKNGPWNGFFTPTSLLVREAKWRRTDSHKHCITDFLLLLLLAIPILFHRRQRSNWCQRHIILIFVDGIIIISLKLYEILFFSLHRHIHSTNIFPHDSTELIIGFENKSNTYVSSLDVRMN